MNKILFVCTGNYYRSRFAEIYFNVQSEKRNLDWNAFSKGFDISNNSNIGLISNHVICELQELKISLPNDLTFPKILTENDLMQAKKIIAMNLSEHKPFVLKQFPTWIDKFTFWSIYDLYEEEASLSLKKLKNKIDQLLHDLYI